MDLTEDEQEVLDAYRQQRDAVTGPTQTVFVAIPVTDEIVAKVGRDELVRAVSKGARRGVADAIAQAHP